MILPAPGAPTARAPRSSRRKWRQAAVLLSLASLGCTPFQTFELEPTAAHLRSGCQAQRGLWVAAQLVADPITVEHYFGPDLRRTEYIPVIVYMENRGDTSFEIHRQSFQLTLESGERFQPTPPGELRAEMRRSSYPALIFAPLIVPAIYFYQRIDDYNFHVARTLHEKSLDARLRLEPGDPPITRALYFRDPSRKTRPRSSLESAVLEVLVAAEGAKLQGQSVGPAQESGPATTQTSGTGGSPRAIGESLRFTVAVSMEDT